MNVLYIVRFMYIVFYKYFDEKEDKGMHSVVEISDSD